MYHKPSKYPFFNYIVEDQKTIDKFERFIDNNLQNVFSDVERARVNYDIIYTEARSVTNENGKYRQILSQLANELSVQSTGKQTYTNIHKQNIFLTIHRMCGGNFRRLMSELQDLTRRIQQSEYQYNIVWYGHYRHIAMTI